jgi:hypothetical protein
MNDAFPDGRHKTVADLSVEVEQGLRTSLGSPEVDWALAYERSLLRPWVRFPLDGDIYEAVHDTPLSFMTQWRAPYTGGGSGMVPRGTRVRVTVLGSVPEPIQVYASPLEADVIERLLVPEADRRSATYNGFILSISTADLNKLFRLVQTARK